MGYAVSGGMVEEKSSRVIELLLSAIRPIHALVGKLIGVGLLGLFQVVAITGVGLGLSLALGEIDLPSTTAGSALLILLFFVLGYALYGCAFAAAGAMVSRQEDVLPRRAQARDQGSASSRPSTSPIRPASASRSRRRSCSR